MRKGSNLIDLNASETQWVVLAFRQKNHCIVVCNWEFFPLLYQQWFSSCSLWVFSWDPFLLQYLVLNRVLENFQRQLADAFMLPQWQSVFIFIEHCLVCLTVIWVLSEICTWWWLCEFLHYTLLSLSFSLVQSYKSLNFIYGRQNLVFYFFLLSFLSLCGFLEKMGGRSDCISCWAVGHSLVFQDTKGTWKEQEVNTE